MIQKRLASHRDSQKTTEFYEGGIFIHFGNMKILKHKNGNLEISKHTKTTIDLLLNAFDFLGSKTIGFSQDFPQKAEFYDGGILINF